MQTMLQIYAFFWATFCLGSSTGIEQDSFARFPPQPQSDVEPGLETDPFHTFKYDLQSCVIDYFSRACDPTCCGKTDTHQSPILPCCESCTELVDLRSYNIPFAINVNATERLFIDHGPDDYQSTGPGGGETCNCNGNVYPISTCPCKSGNSPLGSPEPGWDPYPGNGTRSPTGSDNQVPFNPPPGNTVRTSTIQLVDASLPQSVQPALPDEMVRAKAFKLKIQDVDGGFHDLPACLCGKSRYITTACPCKEESPDKTEL